MFLVETGESACLKRGAGSRGLNEGSETASRGELGLKCELPICLSDCRSVMKHTGALNAVRALETVPARDVCHHPGVPDSCLTQSKPALQASAPSARLRTASRSVRRTGEDSGVWSHISRESILLRGRSIAGRIEEPFL